MSTKNEEMRPSDLKIVDHEILEGIKINGKNILERSVDFYMKGELKKKKNIMISAGVTLEAYKIIKLIGGNSVSLGIRSVIDYFIENNPQIKKLSVINNNK